MYKLASSRSANVLSDKFIQTAVTNNAINSYKQQQAGEGGGQQKGNVDRTERDGCVAKLPSGLSSF